MAHKQPPAVPRLSPVDRNVSRRKLVLSLLKVLLPSQFDEVRFHYEVPAADIPTTVAQVQQAITLIQYALQRESAELDELLDTIFEVAPHLRTPR
jgi:hypothetical protein